MRGVFLYSVNMRHSLSSINLDFKKAVCSVCGPVKIHINGKRRHCYYAYKYGSKNVVLRPKPLNCEICGEEKKLFFDHCHTKNSHRGWLCKSCNLMLGFARDNKQILQAAIDYL